MVAETHVYMKASGTMQRGAHLTLDGARTLSAHRIKLVREKKIKIILRRYISKDLSRKYYDVMQDLVEATHIAVTKAV